MPFGIKTPRITTSSAASRGAEIAVQDCQRQLRENVRVKEDGLTGTVHTQQLSHEVVEVSKALDLSVVRPGIASQKLRYLRHQAPLDVRIGGQDMCCPDKRACCRLVSCFQISSHSSWQRGRHP